MLAVLKLRLKLTEVMGNKRYWHRIIIQIYLVLLEIETIYMDRVANVNGKLIILINVNILLSREEKENLKSMVENLKGLVCF